MRYTLELPGLSKATSQVIFHYLAVFAFAFGTQLVAGATGTLSVSSLLAAITSAAAAGLVAVAHVVLGLIPVQDELGFGISLKVKTAGYQVLVSVLVTFLSIFGAQLAGGAAGITSLPDVTAVLLSAIAAAVTGVVTYVTGLIPAPKP